MTIDANEIRAAEIRKTVELLRVASADRFIKAMQSLEQHGELAEVVEIKRQVRDRIAEVRPPRKINLTRIFCEPFEDLLRNSVAEGASWLPRSSIEASWRIIEGYAEPQQLLRLRKRLNAVVRPSHELLAELGPPLWETASKALATVTATARAGDESARALFDGNEAVIRHAEIMAAACQVAAPLEGLKTLFPIRPFRSLDAKQRDHLLTEMKRLSTESKHDLRCVIHIVAHWTQNPADVFQICSDIDLGPATSIGRALTAGRDKVVVARASEQIDALRTTLSGDNVDIADCAELASVAADCLDSAIAMVKDDKNGGPNSVTQMRQDLRTMVKDRVITVASQALSAAWDGNDRSNGSDRDTVVAAESAARAMRKCGKVASKLGVEAAINKEITSSLAAVRHGVDETLAGLDKGQGQQEVEAAKTTVANATRILEILEGPERAYEFYREKKNILRAQT